MTIAYQSEGSYRLSNGTSLPVPTPGGTVNGDLLFLMASCINATVNITPPAGYTLITSITTGSTTTDGKRSLYWKVANNEGTTQTVSYDGTGTVCEAVCWRLSGADTSSPIDGFASQTGTGTTVTAPSFPTANANTLVCYLGWSSSTTATTWSTPSGFTMQDTPSSSAASWGDAWKLQAAAGATGTASGTSNGTSTDKTIAIMIALKSAVATTPPLIGHQSSDLPPAKTIHPRRYSYQGFMQAPLSDQAPGPSPVCNYIDIPTIDKRQSQIAFVGCQMAPVRDDNAPNYRMPPPWTELPCAKLRRGHLYDGQQRSPLPIEYDVPQPFWTRPPFEPTYRMGRDWTGFQRPPLSINAPVPVFGDSWTDLPVRRRYSFERLNFTYSGVQSLPDAGQATIYNSSQTIPLTGVGNEGLPAQNPAPVAMMPPQPMTDLPIMRGGQRKWTRRY